MHGACQALILAGGRGTRLGDLAKTTPKPLMPISGDRVFLDYIIDSLARAGVTDVLLLAGHLGAQVAERYRSRPFEKVQIEVVIEPEAAGTAGALLQVKDKLAPLFFLLNGDSLFDIDPQALVSALGPKDVGSIALRQVEDASRYGSVVLEGERIRQFREKAASQNGPGLISGGVYALRRSILEHVERTPCSIEVDVFPRLAEADQLAGRAFDAYFIDIGLPETLARAQHEFPSRPWAGA